jgi:hypothetical protein
VDIVNPCYSFFLFDLSLSLSFTFAEKQKTEGGQYLTVTKEHLIEGSNNPTFKKPWHQFK